MTTDILLVTPSNEFGEAVRHTVEDSEIYKIHVALDKTSAMAHSAQEDCRLVLLDLRMGEDKVLDIGRGLRSAHPKMKLAVLCGDETPPSLDAIRPWSLVRIPMHLEELVHAFPVDSEHGEGRHSTPSPQNPYYNESMASSELPAWMADVTKAAAHLTRLTLGSAAQAALITRQGEVWAYAGSLSQEAAREIARTIKRRWDEQKSSDLVCFIRLESTRAEHMLYATRLNADSELALVFESETPFSTIRAQASQLITNLEDENHATSAETEHSQNFDMSSRPTGELRSAFEFAEEGGDEENPTQLPTISEILSNVPSPDPSQSQPVAEESEQGIKWPRRENSRESKMGETRMASPLSNAQVFKVDAQSADAGITSHPKSAQPSQRSQARPKPEEIDATRLSPTTEASRKMSLEPVTAGMYHLTYACLFVPRFSHHYMTGDLADKLSEWLPNICVSFGWRLESLAVRPEYLQWVVNVQPNTSPGFVMRMMRQHTNDKIFQTFGRIKKENPSGDFWAPGYLIMGGSNPHPPQLVRDYIKQIRIRQGLEARR